MVVHKSLYLAAALSVALVSTSFGQSPEEGTGLVCDTSQQVEQVMTAYDKSREWNASPVGVNAEKVVCAPSPTSLRSKATGWANSTPRTATSTLWKILVVGAFMANGLRPVPPEKQVTLFRPKGQDTRRA
jgi:hypothetical protein